MELPRLGVVATFLLDDRGVMAGGNVALRCGFFQQIQPLGLVFHDALAIAQGDAESGHRPGLAALGTFSQKCLGLGQTARILQNFMILPAGFGKVLFHGLLQKRHALSLSALELRIGAQERREVIHPVDFPRGGGLPVPFEPLGQVFLHAHALGVHIAEGRHGRRRPLFGVLHEDFISLVIFFRAPGLHARDNRNWNVFRVGGWRGAQQRQSRQPPEHFFHSPCIHGKNPLFCSKAVDPPGRRRPEVTLSGSRKKRPVRTIIPDFSPREQVKVPVLFSNSIEREQRPNCRLTLFIN